ncbi:prolactin-releasing peptide receptor-like [Oppia nitens]|uniref:prolactin-releasing peptide receptor-like n=1 Tax=Oppia nitens TaxID=1686743 RepID=UPI0023D988B2|nr:prolactin-releasing peptide receptor-like [Oppia nitens]
MMMLSDNNYTNNYYTNNNNYTNNNYTTIVIPVLLLQQQQHPDHHNLHHHNQQQQASSFEPSTTTTGTTATGTHLQLVQDIVILILYGLTTGVGVFGNSLVCYVVFSRPTISTTYILIGNLAISDILGSLSIPGQWLLCSYGILDGYGDKGCGLAKSGQILSYYVSTFTMTVIAYDRYLVVQKPLARRLRPTLPIATVWTLSALCCLPSMTSMRIWEFFGPRRLIYCRIVFVTQSLSPHISTAGFRQFRAAFVMVTQYAIPLSLSTVLYVFCMIKIVSRKRIGAVTAQQSRLFSRSKRRTIQMLTLALMAFALAWLPVHLIHLVDFYITPLLATDCNSSQYYLFFYWLAISSCCFNPFIYCYLNQDFRTAGRRWLRLVLCLDSSQWCWHRYGNWWRHHWQHRRQQSLDSQQQHCIVNQLIDDNQSSSSKHRTRSQTITSSSTTTTTGSSIFYLNIDDSPTTDWDSQSVSQSVFN